MNTLVKELFSKLDVIPSLNQGGCLFACFGVYKKLRSLGITGENIVIVQYSFLRDIDIEHNKKFLNNQIKTARSAAHFGLSADGGETVYDSEGIVCAGIFDKQLIIPNHKIQKFCETSLRTGGWNYRFIRSEEVKRIQKILGVRMKKYNT